MAGYAHELDELALLDAAEDLRALVGVEDSEDVAFRLAFEEQSCVALPPFVASLRGGEPLPELSSLRSLVRILGTVAGDATGDTVPQTGMSGSPLAQAMRGEVLTVAVLDLLQRLHTFPAEEQPWLLLEGLRAMRLLLVVPADAKEAHHLGLRKTAVWWVEDSLGYGAHGDFRRRASQMLLAMMEHMKASYPRKADMKIAVFGALQSLAMHSSESLRHLAQLRAADSVVELLKAQLRALPSAAAFAEGLRVLTALSAGPRLHLRRVMEADAVNIAVELLKQMEAHREVAAAAFVLLGVVAEEHRNLNEEALRLAAEAAKAWPKEVKQELRWARRPLATGFRALLPAEE